MDRNTILAIAISAVIFIAGMAINHFFFSPDESDQLESGISPTAAATAGSGQNQAGKGTPSSDKEGVVDYREGQSESSASLLQVVDNENLPIARTINVETPLYSAVFSNQGAVLKNLDIKQYKEVSMILGSEKERAFFALYWGRDMENPVEVPFYFDDSLKGDLKFSFYQDFKNTESGEELRVTKTFQFYPDQYSIDVSVFIENKESEKPVNLNFNGYAYTLGLGPQIGPNFDELGGRGEYRNFYTYKNEKRDSVGVDREKSKQLENKEAYSWLSIVGKYFALVAIPEARPIDYTYRKASFTAVDDPEKEGAQLYMHMPGAKAFRKVDRFTFYIGPKLKKELNKLEDQHLDEIVDTIPIIGFLRNGLQVLLDFIQGMVKNYGLAIILMTIVIRLLLFPLTFKSSESTTRMQALSPKIKELREKYKDNPQKMNQEVAQMYQKEKINPMSGCWPMLLQIPIFIAFYDLLRTHFPLRQAEFIAPWIADLSQPESIATLPFDIPFLGNAIRILPVLFVATQVLSMKITQASGANTNTSMKMITYAMPVFFFFILYDMPSGLFVYWTFSNILGIFQQMIISYLKKRKKGEAVLPAKKRRK